MQGLFSNSFTYLPARQRELTAKADVFSELPRISLVDTKINSLLRETLCQRDYIRWSKNHKPVVQLSYPSSDSESDWIDPFKEFIRHNRSLFYHCHQLFMKLFYDKNSVQEGDLNLRLLNSKENKTLFSLWEFHNRSVVFLNEVCHNPKAFKNNPTNFFENIKSRIDRANRLKKIDSSQLITLRTLFESRYITNEEKLALKALINHVSAPTLEIHLTQNGNLDCFMLNTFLLVGDDLVQNKYPKREIKNLHPTLGNYGYLITEGAEILIHTKHIASGSFKEGTTAILLNNGYELIRLSSRKGAIRYLEDEVQLHHELYSEQSVHLIPPPYLELKSRGKKDFPVMEIWSKKFPFSGHALRRSYLFQRAKAMADLCFGTHDLHERGILHNDIKPGNLLLDKSPAEFPLINCFVSDLGLCSYSHEKRKKGADLYAHPGFIEKGDHSVEIYDQWSIGITGFDLVYGRRVSFKTLIEDQVLKIGSQAAIDSIIKAYWEAKPFRGNETGQRYFELCQSLIQLERKVCLMEVGRAFLSLAHHLEQSQRSEASA